MVNRREKGKIERKMGKKEGGWERWGRNSEGGGGQKEGKEEKERGRERKWVSGRGKKCERGGGRRKRKEIYLFFSIDIHNHSG